MKRIAVLVGIAALIGFGAYAAVATLNSGQATAPVALKAPLSVSAPARCSTPAPTTVSGYTALWDTVSPAQWGAADLSLSVPLPDGRDVWLYGDTFTTSGHFYHSTGVTQDGGCLHVSHGGAQILPNDGDTIYWINSAHYAGHNVISVNAQAIKLTGTGVFGFTDQGYSRNANVIVSATGDLTFTGWTGVVAGNSPVGSFATIPGNTDPTHFGYNLLTHPEAKLADGKTLVTICQNWTTDGHPISSYKPLFEEE